MKVTYNWLKDFVEITLKPEALANRLTMAGIEVKSLEEKGQDIVFEAEITSNRPDLLSIIGIAREIAAITGKRLKEPKIPGITTSAKGSNFPIKIESKKDCPLYTAKVIRGVTVTSSPDWLKKRLELIGCRSINNIVDITNYILFTYGEPLHAFDLDRLSAQGIFVRRTEKGERIIGIDAQERILDEEALVIADSKRPIALAGIMGGRDSEVTGTTKNILLEAAIFNPALIRASRQKLGMQTDSSYRFERGIDAQTVQNASLAAANLILQLAGGRLTLAKGAGSLKTKRKLIRLEFANADRILGTIIKQKETKKILENLGLKTRLAGKSALYADIPSYRQDLTCEIDIIEEIARIYGYDSIPKTLPRVIPQMASQETRDLVALTKQPLVSLGLNEVITYSLINRQLLSGFSEEEKTSIIEICNPLSNEQEVLRPVLIPSLMKCAAYNYNQKQACVDIFEVANVFFGEEDKAKEELHLAILLSGIRPLMLEQGVVKDSVGPLHLKGICEAVFEKLGVKVYEFRNSEHAGRINILVAGENAGLMMKVPSQILGRFDIKNQEVAVMEISLDKIFARANLSKKLSLLSRFPAITRDISLVLKNEIPIKEVLTALKEKGRPFLAEVKVADYYRGKQIPPGCRGITISCVYRCEERTLTEEEVNPAQSSLRGLLEERFQAKIR